MLRDVRRALPQFTAADGLEAEEQALQVGWDRGCAVLCLPPPVLCLPCLHSICRYVLVGKQRKVNNAKAIGDCWRPEMGLRMRASRARK